MELGNYVGKFVLDDMCGFQKDHEYQIEVSNNGRTYEVSAMYDNTIDSSVDLYIRLSSEKSIRRYFEIE